MQRLKRWLLTLIIGGIGLAGAYVLFGIIFTDFLVELWWHRSVGYERFFWLRLGYRYLLFAFITLSFFFFFFLNFWIGSRYLGRVESADKTETASSRYRQLVQKFRTGSLRVYVPFSVLLGVLVAWPLYQQWEETLLFFFSPVAGVSDPYFGQDLSFYLFALPILKLLLREWLITVTLLIAGLALLYYLESRMLTRVEEQIPKGAKIHLSLLVALLFGLGLWWVFLGRYELVYATTRLPIFFGPGFVEMRVILPLIYGTIIGLVAVALSLLLYLRQRRLRLLLGGIAFLLAVVGLRYSQFLPDLVQRYIVKPNEITREAPFIQKNIEATRHAYNVHQVEIREAPITDGEAGVRVGKIGASLRNIPVWDKEVLIDVFAQLQQLRTYYEFTGISVDRYLVRDQLQQVYLAARELNLDALPAGARNWINQRLKYTHGFGVVMTPAAQGGDEPMHWFIRGIPPTSDYDFEIKQAAIYYGRAHLEPVISPNDVKEMGYPVGDTTTEYSYTGKGGVPINNIFRKLIFAIYFGEKDIFFTTKTNRDSRMLFRRNIVEAVKALTPFFILDRDPYLVVTPEGLFWIQDAYTISSLYPGSQPHSLGFNYIRNSVKIVIDAYNGTIDYYLFEPTDPIARAYQRIYPGLLKGKEAMPTALKPHVRYPRDLFDVQLEIYRKYHQSVEEFYKQEDLWEFPMMERGNRGGRVSPYYLTLNLIDPERADFLLLCPMTPKARANLRALVVVGCDPPHYGKLIVYTFPKGSLFLGPSQVDAIIDQDTQVSSQFTLWNQMGSQVERGRMIVVPVMGSLVYIQSVYLKAESTLRIPQLKRLIICKNDTVVMEPTLEEGFARLEERLQSQAERSRRRLRDITPEGEVQPPPPTATPPPAPAPPPGETPPTP
ncbi:MAG: UPF0182 family protein [Desulfobacca sp.]|uniref:UPF0182 family protein n=1 Tax=Desulfobacca sp. TaxID=2067990 RepID=UPI00404B5910